MKNIQILIYLLAFVLISGCQATGPKFIKSYEKLTDQAVVYLYRPSAFKGGMIVPPVFLNDEEIFELPNSGYAKITLSPGKHTIETRKHGNILILDAVGSANIEVEAGKTYYIKWLPFLSDFAVVPLTVPVAYGSFHGNFYPIEEQQALEEIKECKKVYPNT